MKSFKEELADMCDDYCENMSDQEFRWLIDGLHDKLKTYFAEKIESL